MRNNTLPYSAIPENLTSPMFALGQALHANSAIDKSLYELVYLRVSQLNGCAYCVDMHTKDLLTNANCSDKLHMISVWHESNIYSPRERSALAWAEALTRIEAGISDKDLERVSEHFDSSDLCHLTFAITQINSWNRIAIGFGFEAGSYKPAN